MQVRLILFQAAQQTLGFGDSFFQCNHGIDAASRVSTVPQQWQSASYKLDAGGGRVLGLRFLVKGPGAAARSVRATPRSLAVSRVFQFESGRSAIFQADTGNSAEPQRNGYRRGPFRRARRLGLSGPAKC